MNLLFDLDGTLTDPALGITRCIQHALQKLGWQEVPERSELERFIGPPLQATFTELLNTTEPQAIDRAVAAYRERFSVTGLYENTLYPDISKMLEDLRFAQRLFVATSKPTVYAQRIIDHFELQPNFTRVYGSELDGTRANKTELIAHILAAEGLDSQTTIMIGDRAVDIEGGINNGTRTIGVLWGYGSHEELLAAGPDHIVRSAQELQRRIDEQDRAGHRS